MSEVAEYGPKMRALTQKQRDFVWAMVTQPGLSSSKYAELAGYEGGPSVTKVKACYLLQDQRVIEAIHECADRRMRSRSLVAVDTLVELASGSKVPVAIRLRASEALLDRVGLGSQQNIKVEHTHTDLTGAAMMERIRELAKKHGVDPDKLLTGQAKLENVSRPTEMKVIEYVDTKEAVGRVKEGVAVEEADGAAEGDGT